MSAVSGQGVPELVRRVRAVLDALPAEAEAEDGAGGVVALPPLDRLDGEPHSAGGWGCTAANLPGLLDILPVHSVNFKATCHGAPDGYILHHTLLLARLQTWRRVGRRKAAMRTARRGNGSAPVRLELASSALTATSAGRASGLCGCVPRISVGPCLA